MMQEDEKKPYYQPLVNVTYYSISDVIATSGWGFVDEDEEENPNDY